MHDQGLKPEMMAVSGRRSAYRSRLSFGVVAPRWVAWVCRAAVRVGLIGSQRRVSPFSRSRTRQ